MPSPGFPRQFSWFMASCASGLYAGMALVGAAGIVTGRLTDWTVLMAAPVFAGFGALIGLWAAHSTRRTLWVEAPHRRTRFIITSTVMMPFAVCVGAMPDSEPAVRFILLCGCITGGFYLLTARRVKTTVRYQAEASRERQADTARLQHENAQMQNRLLRQQLDEQSTTSTSRG